MTGKPDRRERKKRETRNRILDAALSLFQSYGFDDTSIDQIAEAADISRGTFFNYFGTKESVLHELARIEIAELSRRAETDLVELPSPVARIRRLMHILVQDTRAFSRVTRYVLIQNLQHPAQEDAFDLHLGALLNRLVQQAQAAGEIRADLNARDAAHAILGAYLAAFFAWIGTESRPGAAQPPLVETMVDLLFEGIAGPRYGGPPTG